ncbi:type III effector HopE1 [Erwinia tracheiphila PSU-1]|nr:type III effector HopE1 [Erwinia tracheiphila PSU-1]
MIYLYPHENQVIKKATQTGNTLIFQELTVNVNSRYHTPYAVYHSDHDNQPESSAGTSSHAATASEVARNINGWGMHERLNDLSRRIESRTTLTTTGYQFAMARVNNPQKLDANSGITMRRAQQYIQCAKKRFPQNTLASLAALQHDSIYRTSDGKLKGGIEMNMQQLTESLEKCRKTGFANCDMQALEMGLHIKHCLGINDFTIYSNKALSHNYVVIKPGELFHRGAIVDSWSGHGVFELSLKNKLVFMHKENNLAVNHTMHAWIDEYGKDFVID